jgi:hypothetical protein
MRDRLLAANVSWTSPEASVANATQEQALAAMDAWLTEVKELKPTKPDLDRGDRMRLAKPDGLVDGCFTSGEDKNDEPIGSRTRIALTTRASSLTWRPPRVRGLALDCKQVRQAAPSHLTPREGLTEVRASAHGAIDASVVAFCHRKHRGCGVWPRQETPEGSQ